VKCQLIWLFCKTTPKKVTPADSALGLPKSIFEQLENAQKTLESRG